MATLNTLRTRGGVIVTVVIGIALLAFLLGDLSSADGMMNARKMRAGEINGSKIGYIEYSNQIDYFTSIEQYMAGKDALSAEEQDRVKDVAWEQMISKYAIMPGLETMGVALSEKEQIDMVDGEYVSPVITNIFLNPTTGSYDPSLLRNFVTNIGNDASGKASMIWEYLKEQMNKQRLMSKYVNVVAKGMFVTNLEVEQGVANANTMNTMSYVVEDYSQIADSTISISNADIKKYYDAHQRMFRQSASRSIEYVVFDVLPSAADYAEAEKHINQIAEEFVQNETPLQYATLNSQSQVNKFYFGPDQMPEAISAFAFGANSGSMYGPVLEGDTYTIARVSDTKMLPDSLGARHILLDPSKKDLADSIVKALKGGANFADLSNQYSLDKAANAQGGDLGMFMPERMITEFSDAAIAANTGDIYTVSTQAGLHVVELTFKSPLRKKAQVAMITYDVEPSDATQQEIYGKATKFVTDAAGKYDTFKSAVTENALSKRVARIRSAERNINGMDNSREVVRWAFNANSGDVSTILEINGDYLVAALAGATEDGIAPLDAVNSDITAILRTEKKGEMLAAKMKGSSLAEIATSLGKEVKEAGNIEFNSFYIDGIGVEPQLIGAVTAVQPNTLSKPVKGSSGVYIFDVTIRETVDQTDAERERVRLQAMAESYITERVNQALFETSDIKDNRVKFF